MCGGRGEMRRGCNFGSRHFLFQVHRAVQLLLRPVPPRSPRLPNGFPVDPRCTPRSPPEISQAVAPNDYPVDSSWLYDICSAPFARRPPCGIAAAARRSPQQGPSTPRGPNIRSPAPRPHPASPPMWSGLVPVRYRRFRQGVGTQRAVTQRAVTQRAGGTSCGNPSHLKGEEGRG